MSTRSPSISRGLAAALRARPPEARGAGIAALAKRLAAELDATDDPDVIAKLSPRLLAAMVELGHGRAAASGVVEGGGASDEPRAVLDQLKERRRARADGPAAVDAPAR